MKTTAKRPKGIKAVRMWTTAQQLAGDNDGTFKCWYHKLCPPYETQPLFQLPADPASVEAMVEQVARALAELRNGGTWPISAQDAAITALSSLGLIKQRMER